MTIERSDVIPLGAHMSLTVMDFEVDDIRFPTSEQLDGSDAMNPDPDYSAAYVVLRTDGEGAEGHGFCFTIGRGNDVQAAAIEALRSYVVGRPVPRTAADLAALYRNLTHDSQLRWLGPEKGVMHMAAGAVVNAAWDLAARLAGKPVWQFLAGDDPGGARLPRRLPLPHATPSPRRRRSPSCAPPSRAAPSAPSGCWREGYPAYTTSPGWLGYYDDKLVRLAEEAVADGFTADQAEGRRRPGRRHPPARARPRGPSAPDIRIAVDANQRWDVAEALEWMNALAPYDPYWIEEPTSPDDVLGHAAIRAGQAGQGRHRRTHRQPGRVQAAAPGRRGRLRPDRRRRVGGVNENLAILLLAAKFGVPVCPHAGGVGLCELVQHLSMFDYVAVSGSLEDRVIEYVDHLHEHFVDPVVDPQRPVRGARRAGLLGPDAPRVDRRGPLPEATSGRPTARRGRTR